MVATLTPLPYLITTSRAMVDQGLVTSLAAAFALVAVGLTLRRQTPPAAAPADPVERHPHVQLSTG
jgi:hypothetical protein